MDTEALVTCPYNKSHRVSQRRLQRHLLKCADSHKETTMVRCKFDATHIVDRMEYEHHMATCPSSGHIRADKYVKESDVQLGSIHLEDDIPIDKSNTDGKEDWDEIDNPANTYNPEHNLSTRNVYRICIAKSKAQKKQFKHMERERFMKIQDNVPIQTVNHSMKNDTDMDKPLRSPRQPAKACSQVGHSNHLNQSTCSIQLNTTEDVTLNNTVDGIAAILQKNLSLSPTSCNSSTKVKTQRKKQDDIGKTGINEISSGGTDVDIKSWVSKVVDGNQTISEKGVILREQQKRNLVTAHNEADDVAKIMARFSTGRGFTRSHKDLKEFIERKPGAPLRRPKQQATAVLQNERVNDIERFSDDVSDKHTKKHTNEIEHCIK